MEGRVAVEQLGYGADAVVEEFLFVAHEQTVHITHLAKSVYLQASLHVESCEPRPSCALMIGIVALNLRTYIHRVVAVTLRGERAHALRRDEFLRAIVEHALLLHSVERRVVQRHRKDHIGAHIVVAIAVHAIVAKVAVLVVEHRSEVLFAKLGRSLQLLDELLVLHNAADLGAEHQSVVPKCVYLDDEARSGNNRPSACGTVHPSDGFVAAFATYEPVLLYVEVRMSSCSEPFHHVLKEFAVLLDAFLHADEVGVLLDAPNCPEQDIRMFHFGHADGQFLLQWVLYELANRLLRSPHHSLELLHLVVGEREARQGDKHIPRPALEPRIACQHIVLVFAMYDELMGAVHERIVEVIARRADTYLEVRQLSQRIGIYFLQTSRKDHTLALLDVELEVARHIQIFRACIAAFLLLRILQTSVPVGAEHELVLLVNLHKERRIAPVHASRDAVLYHIVVTVHSCVLVRKLSYTTESQEGLQPQCCFGMRIHKRVADDDAVLEVLEHHFPLQDDTTHAIDRCGHLQRVELADVLVAARTEVVAVVLVEAEVELSSVLNDGCVEAREQHMVLVVQLGHRHNQQSVVLARIAIHQRRAAVGSRAVRAQHLLRQRLPQVCHQRLIET